MIQVRDHAGSSGGSEKRFDVGCSSEVGSARRLRSRREKSREVEGDSQMWGL